MIVVALLSSAQGVIIPQMLASFGLSLSYGGLLVAINGSASVLTMLVTGLLVDRFGPVRVLVASVALIALRAGDQLRSFLRFGCPLSRLPGLAASSTSAATNALMASTGPRRAYYLGMMHATYSMMSIGAPLLAALVVANVRWQAYYVFLLLLALGVGAVLWRFEHGALRQPLKSRQEATPMSQLISGWRSAAPIYLICLGVFFMAGTQASLATWGYSYMASVYQLPTPWPRQRHRSYGWACWRQARRDSFEREVFGADVVGGRRRPVPCGIGDGLVAGVPGVAMAALVFAGYGVSGAFQLGTSWGQG